MKYLMFIYKVHMAFDEILFYFQEYLATDQSEMKVFVKTMRQWSSTACDRTTLASLKRRRREFKFSNESTEECYPSPI